MAHTVRAFQQPHSAWLAGLLLTLAFLSSSSTLANSQLYQVEMIVFERSGGALSGGEASWQKNVQLEYPQQWQRLIDPREEAATVMVSAPESSTSSEDFLQVLAEERGQGEQAAAAATSAGPANYVYLPVDRRSLQRTREALARQNQYRILFHETWLQPLEPAKKSRALILHGGKRYGDRYELQGWINLGISRFLHVQTDLWLSEFSTNPGETISYGIELPREPVESSGSTDGLNANSGQTPDSTNWGDESSAVYETAGTSAYLVNQVTTMRQKRRMRSGELHYLDDPRMGVLIKLTPQ